MSSGNKIRVLILSHLYPSAIDEIKGIFIHHHVKALHDAGVDLTVVSPVPLSPKCLWFRRKWRNYGMIPDEELIDGIPVKRPRYPALPTGRYRSVAGVAMYYGTVGRIRHLYKGFRFDIIHAHTLTPDGHAALLLKREFRVPVVCSVRGSDLNQYPGYSKGVYETSRRVLEESDAVITVSRDLAREAVKVAGVRKDPYVIYNGVDTTKFYRSGNKEEDRKLLGLPPQARIISFVGRCVADKGIFELFDAFVRIEKNFKDLFLLIVGEGEARNAIAKRIEEYGLEDKVLLQGAAPHEKIPSYLSASNIFVLPSYSEGVPNVIYEAMACGLPVVATRVGGIPEVLSDGREGLLCSPRSSREIEACLNRVLSDPELSDEMGLRGSAKVRELFSWERNGLEHLRVYEEVLGR
jgi:glycosyltransferase involved in cell wall biosynthesis